VIGHWNKDLAVSGKAGIIPYIYVSSVDATLEKIRKEGGQVLKEPSPEGDLWIATFQDPAGNVIGIWQRGPR
jgi:predicted enzyme related to lactoylglutathione lyase